MAFREMSRAEEQAGFTVLWKFGVREAHWELLRQDADFARRVAAVFCSAEEEFIEYADRGLENQFAGVEPGTGLIRKQQVLSKDTNLKELFASPSLEYVTEADILETIRGGKLSKKHSHLFFVRHRLEMDSCQKLEVVWIDRNWHITRSFLTYTNILTAGNYSLVTSKE